jgi:enamine deaminase RidA (YjgF/YER057c/UK114 family)
MSHTRLRKFNTKDTYPEQNLDNDLCQAVVADNIVFLRGQVGQDLETRESVGTGDAAAQTEQAMANIEMLLTEAGARLEDICKVVVYLTDIRYRESVLSGHGPVAARSAPLLNRDRRRRARPPRMGRRDRSDRRHPAGRLMAVESSLALSVMRET